MSQISKAKIFAVLFLPFILSMIISSAIVGYYMGFPRTEYVNDLQWFHGRNILDYGVRL